MVRYHVTLPGKGSGFGYVNTTGTNMRNITLSHERIKQGLRKNGTSMFSIARDLRVSHAMVILVAQRKRRSRRIEQEIADRLGLSLAEVWPRRYESQR